MRKGRIVIVLIVVALAAGTGYRVYRLVTEGKKGEGQLGREVDTVRTAAVEKGNVRRDISLTGDVKAETSVQVFPKCLGRIISLSVKKGSSELPVEEGLSVQKDEVIAVIDHEALDAQVNQGKAALETAKAKLSQAEILLAQTKKDLERIRNLYKEGATSKQSLDKIEAEYEGLVAQKNVADAAVEQSQAVLNQAQIQRDECDVCAPISGIISEKYLDEGDMAMPTRPIVAVVDVDNVKVVADLAERYLADVHKGSNVSIQVDAFPERQFQGIVTQISPIVSLINRTAKLEITVPNPDHKLRPGMFARLVLNIAKREGVPVIPEAAVLRDPSGEYVFVVEKRIARRRNVTLGLDEGPRVEIVEGLRLGEMLVVAGQQKIAEGQRVQLQQ